MDSSLVSFDVLACPICHCSLQLREQALVCVGCSGAYPVVDGIPILLTDRHALQGADHVRVEQAHYYDEQVDEEFEITRPVGTPQLYGWLLNQKFQRSIRGIERMLPGCTALSVCGGSGLDAEFLARTGARVIVSDISLGAIKRARERARRHGFSLFPIVADVERLPFRSRSLDLVYVHDGLHHLVDPMIGLKEMTRVAAKMVSLTEPSNAAATELAIRFGISVRVEDAGNVVGRMDTEKVKDHLERAGLRVVRSHRYAMFYRHEPGWAMRVLSRRSLFPPTRAAWRVVNAAIGRYGNKIGVTATREASPD